MNHASKTIAAAFTACAGVAAAAPAFAETDFAGIRVQLADVMKACPAGPAQRQCIYDFRKAGTEAWNAAHPEQDGEFRACTTPKALEMETQYYMDMLILPESQWTARVDRLNAEAAANWDSCRAKLQP
jgi:hypothetical protein